MKLEKIIAETPVKDTLTIEYKGKRMQITEEQFRYLRLYMQQHADDKYRPVAYTKLFFINNKTGEKIGIDRFGAPKKALDFNNCLSLNRKMALKILIGMGYEE